MSITPILLVGSFGNEPPPSCIPSLLGATIFINVFDALLIDCIVNALPVSTLAFPYDSLKNIGFVPVFLSLIRTVSPNTVCVVSVDVLSDIIIFDATFIDPVASIVKRLLVFEYFIIAP